MARLLDLFHTDGGTATTHVDSDEPGGPFLEAQDESSVSALVGLGLLSLALTEVRWPDPPVIALAAGSGE